MGNFFIWGLASAFTVEQAAFLLVDLEPNDYKSSEKPTSVSTMIEVLANEINSGALQAEIVSKADRVGWNKNTEDSEYFYRPHPDHTYGVDVKFHKKPDWSQTTISADNLREWAKQKSLKPSVFSGANTTSQQDYLDPENPRYAPKLAAAVIAWQAVTNPNGKHPKQALIAWLNQHATEYKLLKDDGSLNETGIEEVAKVANWQDGGGAPKTPKR